MPHYTEEQIREAIREVLAAAAPKAKIFPWWALGHDPSEWPGILKPETGDDSGKVHGYVFTRINTEGNRTNSERVRREFNYVIWGFHYYDETSRNETSSDSRFNAELDAFCNAFEIATNLPESLRRVQVEPEFNLDLDVFGGETLHFARGRLVVEQC
jgi:hypothetical protein